MAYDAQDFDVIDSFYIQLFFPLLKTNYILENYNYYLIPIFSY
jgi:hypothetical protein